MLWLAAAGKALKSTPWQLWAFLALVAAAYLYGEHRADSREDDVRAEYARASEAAERKAREATLRIREIERTSAEKIHSIEIQHLEALSNARTETRDAVLRDLHSGRLALSLPVRKCPSVVSASGDPAASAGQRDAPGDIGGGDAGVVAVSEVEWRVAEQTAIAARADATLTACQSTVLEYIRLASEAAHND